MLRGAAGPVAVAALRDGAEGLAQFGLEVGRPVQPMLAQTAESVTAALERLGTAAVEEKLDGIRVQVHRDGDDVRVFTRTLDDVTSRLPEVVEAVLSLPVRAVVLDGEAIALDDTGRPLPFQVTASRVGSKVDVARARSTTPLSSRFFDLLHLDGTDLLDRPARDRSAALTALAPESLRVPRLETDDAAAAEAFLADSLRRGHEGVVVKSLDSTYDAGRRGAGWLKVKPVHTLDLVVLAVEWGSGRRRGWLSNLHLGARADDGTDGLVMLGKTFKGLTDDMLRWQTERLLELETSRNDWQVFVRPELVVEVAFDGVQTSSRYPGGMALRFARVVRHRPDKRAQDADTVAAVRAVHIGARAVHIGARAVHQGATGN
jgi:DNA ligase-1